MTPEEDRLKNAKNVLKQLLSIHCLDIICIAVFQRSSGKRVIALTVL